MKRAVIPIVIICMAAGLFMPLKAQDASPAQFFYVVKKLLPDMSKLTIFMNPDNVEGLKGSINRAALQNHITVKIFPVSSAIELGKHIRQLPEASVLIVLSSSVLTQKSSAVYVLKKCIEKNIAVVSSSQAYSDLGAFLSLIKGPEGMNVVVNMKQYADLKSKVTQENLQLAGVTQVIE